MNEGSSLEKVIARKDPVLFEGRVGLLSNQISYSFRHMKYLFEVLSHRKVLKSIFIPEHGLFGELQDQIPLDSVASYQQIASGSTFKSLYQSNKDRSLRIQKEDLTGLDVVIVDVQDIGSRYYTYLSTIKYLFETITENGLSIKVIFLDHPNPAGRQVEGSMMSPCFSSFIGPEKLPHRYGLSIGEIAVLFNHLHNYQIELEVIKGTQATFPIQPSPNIPDVETCLLYSGQCLVEGTTLSEGRGTTLPFKLVGAPFLEWNVLLRIRENVEKLVKPYNFLREGIFLRPLFFKPKFDKWSDQTCGGFQLHLTGNQFHALLYSAILLRTIAEMSSDQSIWRKGSYEYGNDGDAIQLLAGDHEILKYLFGETDLVDLIEYLEAEENLWLHFVNGSQLLTTNPYSLLLQSQSRK